LPPEKRTRTGKARGRRRENRPGGDAPTSVKRLPTSLLVTWFVAIIFLGLLLYFSRQDRRLPELPLPPDQQKRSDSVAGAPHQEVPAAVSSPKSPPASRAGDIPSRDISSGMNDTGARQVRDAFRGSSIPSHTGPKASIVIDDFGPNLVIARRFASLPFPVTLSVLPYQAHSREIAELAHEAGREVILHLPMEPLSRKENPGPGALLISMSADQIQHNIRAALDTSPYFDGVNNHMGSRMTRDERAMKTVLSELRGRDLFFIDSMTTSESRGWKAAKELNVPNLKRDIFLDDDPSQEAVRSQIIRLMKVAKVRGMALAIGHPRETTLRSLQEAAPNFRKAGIEIVSAHDLLNGRAGGPKRGDEASQIPASNPKTMYQDTQMRRETE